MTVIRLNNCARCANTGKLDATSFTDPVSVYVQCDCAWGEIHTKPQPPPVQSTRPHITDLVIEDLKARKQDGIKKYGTALQAFNGRSALIDAYQESLDLPQYLKQEIEERKELEARILGLENEVRSLRNEKSELQRRIRAAESALKESANAHP